MLKESHYGGMGAVGIWKGDVKQGIQRMYFKRFKKINRMRDGAYHPQPIISF